MLRSTNKRLWFVLSGLGLLLAASMLTACTVSASGGVAGVIGALALGAALLGLGASTSGCDDDVGACLSFVDIGACLSPPIDAGLDVPPSFDACLSPDGSPPAEVGPCLQPPLPDAGPDAANPDAANPDATKSDTKVGPCLSPPPLPLGALEPELRMVPAPALESRETQRAAAIARLAARLPGDVAERLGGQGDDGSA
jgi:hypothetical protein